MAGTKISNPLVAKLLDGLTVSSRPNQKVHTVTVGGKTCAEICVGKTKIRLNFKQEQEAKARPHLGGKSHSWTGGGMLVDEASAKVARSILDAAVQKAHKGISAAQVAADPAARKREAAKAKLATVASRGKQPAAA